MGISNLVYIQRRPDKTDLYRIFRENLETFLSQANMDDHRGVPDYVEKEFRAYLDCGLLANGFLRCFCTGCGRTKLLPLSCKGRTICPTCSGKRMNETSVHITDNLMPKLPSRQWVVTSPIPLRYWMASNPKLQSAILTIVMRVITRYYKDKLKKLNPGKKLQTGAITIIQRAGSALNLNPHFHILSVDGAYSVKDGDPVFYKAPTPKDEDIKSVIKTISERIIRYLIKKGYIYEITYEDQFQYENPMYSSLLASSARNVISMGPGRHQRMRCLIAPGFGYENERAERKGQLCFAINNFSLHAATSVKSHQKWKLEKICRYILRPIIAVERIKILNNGDISYKLKRAWDNGVSHVIFTPMDFLAKLAALVPPSRAHQIRFHGFLAPHSAIRPIVATSRKKLKEMEKGKGEEESSLTKEGKLRWVKLLERVFQIDITVCDLCGSKVKILSAVLDPVNIRKILNHIGLDPIPPPILPAKQIAFGF